jgi:hypothetical protein
LVQRIVEVSTADSSEYTCVATYLPVRSWFHLIPFLRTSGRVERQLKTSPGIVRYGLKTNLPRKRFWTYSVWKSRESIGAFVTSEPHVTAVKKFSKWAGEGAAFVEWKNTDGNIDWEEAERRLENPSFYYHK